MVGKYFAVASGVLALVLVVCATSGRQQSDKPVEGFGESRRGDVPEGTLALMTPETDEAINNGLAWLGRTQNADGSFGVGAYRGNIAVTSLAGLAFMASGSSPGRGPYGAKIDKALVYVMENTSPSGFIVVARSATHGPMYSHGFGTLFLAEAYGMTHRPEIREKLQKAVRLIVDSQNIEGGWRYQPVRRDADLSVTICQINALRAARTPGFMFRRRPSTPASDTSNSPRITMEAFATSSTEGRPASFRGPRLAWSRSRARGNTTPRRSATGSPTCVNPTVSPAPAGETAISSTASTMRPRRCGFKEETPGSSGIRQFATSCSATVGGRLLERQ